MFAVPRYTDYPAATTGTASYSGGQWIDDHTQHHQHWQSETAAAGNGSAAAYPSLAASAPDTTSIQTADTYTDYSYPSYFPDRAAIFPSTSSSASLNGWVPVHTPNYHYNYGPASGSESSNTGSPLQSNASATSSLPSSPASGYGQRTSLSAFASPTPGGSAYARPYPSQRSPPPQSRAQPRARAADSKSKPDSTVHAFSLSTLEPLDASDDPYPVSMTDLMRSREDIEYGGLSYRFALPNSVAAAAAASGSASSSGRCTPNSDADADRGFTRSSAANKRKPKVKLHPCDVCGKAFPRPSGLKTHMNSHSGEKPFPCPVKDCNKTFTVRSNAKRHLRTHGIVPEPRSAQGNDGTIDFDTPVVAEEIAEARIDGRKMRIRWHGARPAGREREEPLPRSVRGTEKESRSSSASSSTLASPAQIAAVPPSPPAPRQSAPSISYALGTPNYL